MTWQIKSFFVVGSKIEPTLPFVPKQLGRATISTIQRKNQRFVLHSFLCTNQNSGLKKAIDHHKKVSF
ncbi:MAG: hypothetical protein CVU42_03165 [Chloroflexi bacterium HGW-Chloroflexi-4]|nr:MAG: hypothetical protein CVU42_03165 [Chloroflexi bacterium HGW-Chloroflexi-4]